MRCASHVFCAPAQWFPLFWTLVHLSLFCSCVRYKLFQNNKSVTLPIGKPNERALKIKDIRVEHKAQHVFISYKIYEINANVNVVEISRGRGDAIVFYKCMARMTQEISDCLGSGMQGGLIGNGLSGLPVEAEHEGKSGGTY